MRGHYHTILYLMFLTIYLGSHFILVHTELPHLKMVIWYSTVELSNNLLISSFLMDRLFLIKCYYEQCCNEYTYTSMCQHMYVQVYLLNNSKNRIAGSIDIYFFNFDRFYQIMLWRGWTHLYFQQKMMSSSFPLFSYNHVLLKIFYLCQSGILKLVISF